MQFKDPTVAQEPCTTLFEMNNNSAVKDTLTPSKAPISSSI